MKHGYSLWMVAVFSTLDFSLSGSLPACLPESLRYFQSLSSTTNQLYDDRCSIRDHLTPNVQSSNPKLFTKMVISQVKKEPKLHDSRESSSPLQLAVEQLKHLLTKIAYSLPKKDWPRWLWYSKVSDEFPFKRRRTIRVTWHSSTTRGSTCLSKTGGVVGKWHQCTREATKVTKDTSRQTLQEFRHRTKQCGQFSNTLRTHLKSFFFFFSCC